MVLETPSDQLHRVAWIPLFNMLQRYEKYSKQPNISAIFFAKKQQSFCIVNNPSLSGDKGMLLRDKGMFLQLGRLQNDKWQMTVSKQGHHTTCPAVIFVFIIILYTIIIYIIIYKYKYI